MTANRENLIAFLAGVFVGMAIVASYHAYQESRPLDTVGTTTWDETRTIMAINLAVSGNPFTPYPHISILK
jgi:hypothetical protein